jgi:GNAT superfamily N-acetyltransferase
MQTRLTIEPLGNAFSSQAIDLILPIQQVEFNVPVTLADQPDLLDIEHYYTGSGGGFWGALYDGQLVGTIGLIAIAGQGGVIRKMFVKREFRGKEWGIAQQLLDILITYSRQQGIQTLYLGTVTKLEAAIRFYTRNGFQVIPKADLPAAFPIMQADNVFYYLELSRGI